MVTTRHAQPRWPRQYDRRAWLLCTARWGLALAPDNSDRCYVHFALEALAELGLRRDVERIVSALQKTAGDNVVNAEADMEAMVLAALAVGDDAWAERCAASVFKRYARTVDAQALAAATANFGAFRQEQGWLSQTELAKLPQAQQVIARCHRADRALNRGDLRLARLETRAAARLVKRADDWHEYVVHLLLALKDRRAAVQLWQRLPASTRAAYTARHLEDLGVAHNTATKAATRGRRALKALVPEEWNLHFVTGELSQAVSLLMTCGHKDKATKLVEAALLRVERGGVAFDSRSFASVGAFVDLGRMAFACLGKARALPLFERAMQVPKAAAFRPQVVKALLEAGAVDEALALVKKVPKKAQPPLVAEAMFLARRSRELHETLAGITEPKEALRLAWGFCRHLT